MHGLVAAAALLVLGQSFTPGALGANVGLIEPERIQIGIITELDTVGMDFVCQTNRLAQRYWITQATQLQGRWSGASFFDLRTGQPVKVIFHDSGRLEIADLVIV